jgi:hypothetical protein
MKHVANEAFAMLLNAVMCVLLATKNSKPSIGRATTAECSLTRPGYGLLNDFDITDKNAANAAFGEMRSNDAQIGNVVASN